VDYKTITLTACVAVVLAPNAIVRDDDVVDQGLSGCISGRYPLRGCPAWVLSIGSWVSIEEMEEMNPKYSIAATVVLAGLLIASATAQTPSPGQGDGTATTAITVPAGSLQKAQNGWRGRMMIGTPVFSDNGRQIATIDDLLITDDGKVDRVVLSVTRRRRVAVPFSQLRFVPSQIGTRIGRRARRFGRNVTNAFRPFGAMLPGANGDTLASMEEFRFVPSP
jgi:hypothetical protein